jgi:hypothetical protein
VRALPSIRKKPSSSWREPGRILEQAWQFQDPYEAPRTAAGGCGGIAERRLQAQVPLIITERCSAPRSSISGRARQAAPHSAQSFHGNSRMVGAG